ncbi:MAG: hypothetical protein KBT67_09155 [bacterium]|nr:hypothetical protein [Candidatus Limimorpha caballi]
MNHVITRIYLTPSRYEDSSLEYTGINCHENDSYIGVFDAKVAADRVIVGK